jgi:hypothetical protein
MRKLSYAVAASLLVFGLAGQAHAVALGFTGSVTIQLATLSPIAILNTGAPVATVNGANAAGHLTGLQFAASPFSLPPTGMFKGLLVPVTDPAASPIFGVIIAAHNANANFAGVGNAGFGGTMPLNGSARVCLFASCGKANNAANLNIPLSVVGGPGGSTTVTGAVNLTVVGAPWTTGIAAVGTITQMGGAAPASNTGAASGTVKLVTPIFISTNIAGASAVVPAFAILNLHFVPEPGTLMLLGSGIAGLMAFGRSRVR